MRIVSRDAATNLINGVRYNSSNTKVSDGKLYLHNNKIIEKIDDFNYKICFCGWSSNTTKERIRTFFNVLMNSFGVRSMVGIRKDKLIISGHSPSDMIDKEIDLDYCKTYDVKIKTFGLGDKTIRVIDIES